MASPHPSISLLCGLFLVQDPKASQPIFQIRWCVESSTVMWCVMLRRLIKCSLVQCRLERTDAVQCPNYFDLVHDNWWLMSWLHSHGSNLCLDLPCPLLTSLVLSLCCLLFACLTCPGVLQFHNFPSWNSLSSCLLPQLPSAWVIIS